MIRTTKIAILMAAGITAPALPVTQAAKKLKVLVVNETLGKTGISVFSDNVYKQLIRNNIPAIALIAEKNNALRAEYDALKLPYHTFPCTKRQAHGLLIKQLATIMQTICTKENITIIHGNNHIFNPEGMAAAKLVAKKIPVKVVATIHSEPDCCKVPFKGLDGVISIGPAVGRLADSIDTKEKTGVHHRMWIAPFFDQERFLSFVPTQRETRRQFFKNTFNIVLSDDVPVISMVAQFYKTPTFKNHDLLLRALHKLVYVLKKPAYVIFAGAGVSLAAKQQLSRELDLSQHVFFVGQTDQVPALLYHSDICALTGKSEAFGIALLEAALMQKPLIGTRGTGMEALVRHGHTGLLFESGNVDDLTKQIVTLLDDAVLRKKLGQQAHAYARDHFSADAVFKKLVAFYDRVLG